MGIYLINQRMLDDFHLNNSSDLTKRFPDNQWILPIVDAIFLIDVHLPVYWLIVA